MNKLDRHFELATKLALKSEYKYKLGCVIAKKNRIVGLGFNKPYKTHPDSPNEFKNIHAELDALIGVDHKDLQDATVYVSRIRKDGRLALSMPCQHCMELLRKAGVGVVYWTTDDDTKGYHYFKGE